MAQKYLHGQVGGMRCPTSCHIIGKAKPPRQPRGTGQEGMRKLPATRAGGLTLPPGLPSLLCFHPDTSGCEGTFQKDHRGASAVGREQEWQQAKASLCQRGGPLPLCCNRRAGQSLKTTSAPASPLEAEGVEKGQESSRDTEAGVEGRQRGIPSCLSAQGWGQSRDNQPKSLKASKLQQSPPTMPN